MKRIQSLLDIQEKEFEKVTHVLGTCEGSRGSTPKSWLMRQPMYTNWPEVCVCSCPEFTEEGPFCLSV